MAGTPISLTPLQARVDGFVGTFTQTVLDWKTLAAFTAGGLAGRAGSLAVSPQSLLGKAASLSAGLGAETLTFELTHRSLQNDARLWRWNGLQGMKAGLLHSALTFGSLKGAGKIAQGENLAVQHLLQDTALVGAHQLGYRLGLASKPQGSLADQFLDAEATTLQVGAALALGHSLVPSLAGLDLALISTLKMRDGGTELPRILGGRTPALAGGPTMGSPEASTPGKASGLFKMARSDISYPGLQALPTTFKNGELFTVNRNRVPEGIAVVYVPEAKHQMKAEEAIIETISAHLSAVRKKKVEPFMVVYMAKNPIDPKAMKEKIHSLFGQSLPEDFLVVVANPNGIAAGAVLYKKKQNGFEMDSWSTIRAGLTKIPAFPEPVVRGSPPAKEGGRVGGIASGQWALDQPAARPEKARKHPETSREASRVIPREISRTQSLATVSDAADHFRQLLVSLGERKDLSPGSWFVEISGKFVSLSDRDLKALSEPVDPSDFASRSAKGAVQASIIKQIQTELIDRLASILKKYPIPAGHVVHIKWKEPLPAFLRIQEENGVVQLSVSGSFIPPRSESRRRDEIQHGSAFDLVARHASETRSDPSIFLITPPSVAPAAETPPTPGVETRDTSSSFNPYGHLMGSLEARKGGDWDPIRLSCDLPSGILENLGSLLDSQQGKFLPPRPIRMNLASGMLDRDFLSSLIDFLREHPPLDKQEIHIESKDSRTRLTARNQGGEISGEVSEHKYSGTMTVTMVARPDGTKTEGSHYSSR